MPNECAHGYETLPFARKKSWNRERRGGKEPHCGQSQQIGPHSGRSQQKIPHCADSQQTPPALRPVPVITVRTEPDDVSGGPTEEKQKESLHNRRKKQRCEGDWSIVPKIAESMRGPPARRTAARARYFAGGKAGPAKSQLDVLKNRTVLARGGYGARKRSS
jgi:hypothetical protein